MTEELSHPALSLRIKISVSDVELEFSISSCFREILTEKKKDENFIGLRPQVM